MRATLPGCAQAITSQARSSHGRTSDLACLWPGPWLSSAIAPADHARHPLGGGLAGEVRTTAGGDDVASVRVHGSLQCWNSKWCEQVTRWATYKTRAGLLRF